MKRYKKVIAFNFHNSKIFATGHQLNVFFQHPLLILYSSSSLPRSFLSFFCYYFFTSLIHSKKQIFHIMLTVIWLRLIIKKISQRVLRAPVTKNSRRNKRQGHNFMKECTRRKLWTNVR